MTEAIDGRLFMSANGIKQALGPDDPALRARYESLVRDDYERAHPNDSFDDLKRRARFSKEDQGLLRDWMDVAVARIRQCRRVEVNVPAYSPEP